MTAASVILPTNTPIFILTNDHFQSSAANYIYLCLTLPCLSIQATIVWCILLATGKPLKADSLPLLPRLRPQTIMATKSGGQDGLAPILAALSTMQSNVQGKDKVQAHEYLEKFQKSVRLQIEW